MERYGAYKDSGVDWIGEIPAGWETTKVGQLFSSRRETVSDSDYAPLSVTKNGIVPQLENVAKTDNRDNRLLVRKGDFVINSRSDRRGSCGFSVLDGSVTQISLVLEPQKLNEVDTRYYSWLFSCERFSDEFYRNGHGIVADLWSTKWSDMKGISLPIPPSEDRARIVAYLDEKTGAIDAAVKNIERSIELLNEYRQSVISEAVTKGLDPTTPMKDSGIDWIGQIPESWHIEKLKWIGTIQKGSGIKREDITSEGKPCIRYGELYTTYGYQIEEIASGIPQALYETQPKLGTGEIVMALTGENEDDIGRVSVNMTNSDIAYGGDTLAIKNLLADGLFISFSLNSRYFNIQRTQGARGDIIVHLPERWVSNCQVIMPPLQEQRNIAKSLDQQCKAIESLIQQKQSLVVRLKEYRTSLISECVTGKVKVPGVEE